MLVVMRQDAGEAEIRGVVAAVEARGYKGHPIPGAHRTAIGITGNKGALEAPVFESLPGVLEVIPVTHAYKLVSREVKAENTVVAIGGVEVGGAALVIMAGPCAVETREQTLTVARARQEGGSAHPAGGRVQAAHQPLLVPGPGRGGAPDPGRGPGRDRPAGGDGSGGRACPRPRRGARRRHPDRRPQHAELLAAEAGGQGAKAGGPEARDLRNPRGVPDVGGVHPGRGELRSGAVRARGTDLLRLLAQHPGPGGGARGEGVCRTCPSWWTLRTAPAGATRWRPSRGRRPRWGRTAS